MPRTYDMTRRTRGAAQTAERIAESAESLLATRRVGDVTLQAIAEGAGVSAQTVLRHMGSRDGCFAAVGERVLARIDAARGRSEPGDVDGALTGLLSHYEADGRLVLNLLAQEAAEPVAREAVESGRSYHRAWVLRCFGPLMGDPEPEAVDALVAATDLSVWKLLRLDLGRTQSATRAVVERLVRAALEPSWERS